MTSIRRFLVIVLLASITLFNFVAAIEGYRTGIAKTHELFDEELVNIAHIIGQTTEPGAYNRAARQIGDLAFQVFSADGRLQFRSENTPDHSITSLQAGFSDSNFSRYRWRCYAYQVESNGQWVLVAERLDLRYQIADSVILETLMPIIFGLPVIGLLVWLIVGSGLKPLRDLAEALGTKKPNDLSPLDTESIPYELQQLIHSTNALFQRLEDSFNREKRFSGDAAHELRTPLSVLKVQVYNLEKQLPEAHPSIELIKNSIDRMSHLIEQMLSLYRTTPEQFLANFSCVDLHALAQDVISNLYDKIDAKGQTIELSGDSCTLTGDAFALQALLKNLIDNAHKYTPEQGHILVTISERNQQVTLCVEDDGIGISPELYPRVFERFYRVDGDMHRSQVVGCGLGLAIVKHIVELHQGQISLGHSRFRTGLAVTVTLPKAIGEENACA